VGKQRSSWRRAATGRPTHSLAPLLGVCSAQSGWIYPALSKGKRLRQLILKAGVSIEGAAKVFEQACLGKVSSYAKCAHYLSNAFIVAGFAELSKPNDCVSSGGRCIPPNCTSGGKRPIRAKDLECWFLTKDASPATSVKPNTGLYAVYQERQSDGEGHVVILDSNTWKYYGTGWF
jgi:hypothetical protein